MEIVAGKIMAGISKCLIIFIFQVLMRPGLRFQNRRVETGIKNKKKKKKKNLFRPVLVQSTAIYG